jgi:DNA repair protein RadC
VLPNPEAVVVCKTIYPTVRPPEVSEAALVIDIAGPLGIFVQDHIIVRKNGHARIKGLKLI